ncbi:hypothetical protein RGAI101_2968 [Roseobacter sp. GAI101]|nr:hypothetical protein RGAI101_2968 [Roseobacter sp. GAI101]
MILPAFSGAWPLSEFLAPRALLFAVLIECHVSLDLIQIA